MTRRWRVPVIALMVTVAGTASLGHGAWIFVKAQLAQLMLQQAWRRTVEEGIGVAPWPWADTWPVARLEVPGLDSDLIVLAGGSGRTIAFGPGHLDSSAPPGRRGNCVLAGHRDTHFGFLQHLETGDELLIHRPDGAVVSYRVTGHRVVHRDDLWVVQPHGGLELTLVTCYPFHDPLPGGPLRYVVHAAASSPDSVPLNGPVRRTAE